MKNRLLLLTATVAMLFANSAINGQNFIKATKSNAGQTVTLTTDQVLEISLPCNPSSGYGWYEPASGINKNIKTIEQSGDWEFVPYTYNEGKVGEPGEQIIRYVGVKQGTTNLKLEYRRPFEKNKPAADEYTVTIQSAGKYTGSYAPPAKPEATHNNNTNTPLLTTTLPSSFSWQSQCTPIKDQGQCGSCWSFAGTGTFEAVIKIVDGNTRNLSEQCLINCAPTSGDDGCEGGYFPGSYWTSKGAVYESDCPYIDYSCQYATSTSSATCVGSCATYPYHEKPTSCALVAGSTGIPSVASLQSAIYNYGPVWVTIDAGTNFQNYTGGIFTTTDGTTTDHAVVLVGWVTDAALANGGYWILRNSWNTDWGESGYMRIEYGISAVGTGAEYINYKGTTIPQSVAPVAHFAANTTTSCTGVVQFSDLSTNVPTAWSWTFGDGGTSTLQNPTYTYTASGTYTVSLTATNSFGSNTSTTTNYVTVDLSPAPPTAPNVSRCGTGAVTLVASGGTNSTYYWYDANSNFLGSSPSYTTPSLTATTTYYVEDVNIGSQTSLNASTATPNATCSASGCNYALLFNITNNSSVNSIIVTGISSNHYNAETKSYATQVYYRPSTYVGHESSSTGWTQVYSGNTISAQVIPVTSFTIPPGGVYGVYLYIASDGGLFSSGANTYPNTDMTITTGSRVCSPTAAFTGGTLTAGYSMFGSVYYKTICCASPLTACEAVINTGTAPVATASNNGPVCAGSSLSLTGGPASMTSYVWSGPSSYSSGTQSPAVSASSTTAMSGTYTLTVTATNGCTGSASTAVTVNSEVTASVKIAASPSGSVKSGTTITFTATPTNGGSSPTYKWLKNGTTISGATSSTYKSNTLANGNIISCVMTSDAACVTGSPATSNSITVSIKKSSTESSTENDNPSSDQILSLEVYPNPVSDVLTVEIPQQGIAEIFNTQGQLVKNIMINEEKTIIDVSAFSGGLYVIKVKTDDGVTAFKKFVKE